MIVNYKNITKKDLHLQNCLKRYVCDAGNFFNGRYRCMHNICLFEMKTNFSFYRCLNSKSNFYFIIFLFSEFYIDLLDLYLDDRYLYKIEYSVYFWD